MTPSGHHDEKPTIRWTTACIRCTTACTSDFKCGSIIQPDVAGSFHRLVGLVVDIIVMVFIAKQGIEETVTTLENDIIQSAPWKMTHCS